MPEVSVIILTRNRPHLLKRAVQSVFDQTFQDFELIIVDDASNDETPDVINNFNDQRIKYLRNLENKGEAGSRNEGLKAVQGEFVAFLDDDDEWLSQKIELQVNVLRKKNETLGLVYTGYYEFDLETKRIIREIIPKKKGDLSEEIFIGNWIGLSTVLVKNECFQDIGRFDESLASAPDYDMWIRMANKYEFDYIAMPLVKYGVHSQQLTMNYRKMILGREKLLEKHGEFFSIKRKEQSEFWLNFAVWYCYDGQVIKGIKTLLFGLKKYPQDVRFYYNLVLALFGKKVFEKVKEKRNEISSNK